MLLERASCSTTTSTARSGDTGYVEQLEDVASWNDVTSHVRNDHTLHSDLAPHRAASGPPPRCLDGGDVDLLHRHHRLEGALRLGATSRQRVGQRARGDLPREAPAILAPPARAFLAAVADNRIP